MSSRKLSNLDFVKIGARICSERERLRLTQQDLADKLGFKHKSSVDKMESGKQPPSAAHLTILAALFHRSVDWILTGKYGGERVRYEIADPDDDLLEGLDHNDRIALRAVANFLREASDHNKIHLRNQVEILLAADRFKKAKES